MHSAEKHKCTKCEIEFSNVHYLKEHIKNVHEKIPCVHCGKLFGLGKGMGRHIDTQHTSNDEKKGSDHLAHSQGGLGRFLGSHCDRQLKFSANAFFLIS